MALPRIAEITRVEKYALINQSGTRKGETGPQATARSGVSETPSPDARTMNDMAPVSDHLTSRRRAEQALHLRAKQRTWREISEQLGYRTEAGARSAVRRLLPTLRLAPEEGRRISAETLRVIQRPLIDLYDALAVPGGDIAEVTMLARSEPTTSRRRSWTISTRPSASRSL